MKEQAIQKINKIGKVSSVIALIGKILIGIAMVLSMIGAIACLLIPKDLLTVSIEGTAIMEVDVSSLGITLTEEDIAEVKEVMMEDMDEDDEFVYENTEFTSTGMKFVGDTDVTQISMRDIAVIWLFALVTLVMTFITLCFISALCKAFRDCQSPFEENVIKKMQNLGYSLIPWAVVSTITNSVTDSLMNNKLSLNFTVDLGVVLIVLVVLVLVYIFKYGAVLQQESDETL